MLFSLLIVQLYRYQLTLVKVTSELRQIIAFHIELPSRRSVKLPNRLVWISPTNIGATFIVGSAIDYKSRAAIYCKCLVCCSNITKEM